VSFKESAVPLHLDLRPSGNLRALLTGLHGAVAVIALVGGADRSTTAIVFTLLLLSLASALFWVRRPVSLVWRADGRVEGSIWRNSVLDADVLPATFEHPRLVILHLKESDTGTTWRVPVAQDSVDSDTLRRLRVRLRASVSRDGR